MYQFHRNHQKGFSLIELLVVIAITAVLLAVVAPNLLSARERARDARKKQEVNEMKNALRMYYTDFQVYPANSMFCNGKANNILGCGALHNTCCPCDTSVDFAVGDTCSTVYMKKFPSDFKENMFYYSSGDDFCLKVALENAADGDIAISQSRCATACGTYCTDSKDYCTCAD